MIVATDPPIIVVHGDRSEYLSAEGVPNGRLTHCFYYGADGGTRTRTRLSSRDFKTYGYDLQKVARKSTLSHGVA